MLLGPFKLMSSHAQSMINATSDKTYLYASFLSLLAGFN